MRRIRRSSRELRDNPAQQAASQYMLMFRSEKAEAILSANNYAALVAAVTGTSEAFTEVDRAAYVTAWSQPGALTGGLNYYRAARIGPPVDDETRAGLRALPVPPVPLAVPTLVIWGEADTALLTGNLDGLEQFVTNLKVVRIPEGTHWVVHEQPERVNAEIRAFLTTT
jgi:pimeloyl-ACP methyl ester carboxylesterase